MKKRVKLTFPKHLIKKPVIFTIAKKYNVMPNIRHARITEEVGEMVLEFEGDKKNLEAGIEALRDQGVGIEYITADAVEQQGSS